MKLSVVAAVALSLLGCACGKLRQDPNISSIEAGYPSAEMIVNGERALGLKQISVTRGTDLSTLDLGIQTYFQGEVRVDSHRCGLGFTKTYQNSEVVGLDLNGPAERSCVITFTVAPRYPKQTQNTIVVYPFRGHLSIRVIDAGEDWVGAEAKVTGKFSKFMKFNIGGDTARAVFTGCGIDYDKQVTLEEGIATVDLGEMVENRVRTCVLEGVFISPVYKDLLVSILVSDYKQEFNPLAIPAVTVGEKMCIQADQTASIITHNNKYMIKNEGCFKALPVNGSVVRALTVKGRAVMGVYKDGEFIWNQ